MGFTAAAFGLGFGRGTVDALLGLARFVDRLPQGWLWIAVSALGAWSVLVAILRLRPSPRAMLRPPGGQTSEASIHELGQLIREARRQPGARASLGRRLAELSVAVRARCAGVTPGDARREVRAARWPTDASLQRVLDAQDEGGGRDRVGAERYAEDIERLLTLLENCVERRRSGVT